VKAIERPSGDQEKSRTAVGGSNSLCGSPPSTGIVQIAARPSRSLRNASVFPSGDQRGCVSLPLACVSWRSLRPSAPITQTSASYALRARSAFVRT